MLWKCTFRASSSLTRSANPLTLRPSRSSFQTTRVSASRKCESSSSNPHRLKVLPRASNSRYSYRRGRNEKNESRTVFENLKAAFLESLTHTFKDKCVTSDHRVAGSSPAGCKASLVKDKHAVLGAQFVNAKNAVIDVIFGATARWTEFVNRR